MRPQAHVASGLLLWSATGAPLREAPLGALAANLPDFDRNVAKALGVQRRDHHRWVSHSFAGWVVPTLLMPRRFAAGVWLHLLLDSWYDGIAWLWPLSEQKIGLFQRPPGARDRGWRTPAPLSTPGGKLEAAMWVAAAALALSGTSSRRAPSRGRRGRPRRRRRRPGRGG